MFNNISYFINSYIYLFKFLILNPSFDEYILGVITFEEYYNINMTYINFILNHNRLIGL